MDIYGYTKVCSEGGYNGKESTVNLFTSKEKRNEIMYADYDDSFDNMEANDEFDTNENDEPVDYNDEPKMTREEFMKDLEDSKDMEQDVFGVIQAADFHVQFEPFHKII